MSKKMDPTKGQWSAGVYVTTSTIIQRLRDTPQSCVCVVKRGKPGLLVALCGPADDVQSQRDADLFAAAKDMVRVLELCHAAIAGPAENGNIGLSTRRMLDRELAKVLKKARGTHG